MFKRPRADFWRVGIAPIAIEDLPDGAALKQIRQRITWLPDAGPWRYLADPFGLQRDDALHVFVEAFDYQTKHAVIERHELGLDLSWRSKTTVLARTFHLSYPFIVEHDGETFMVPESHKAGEIALYRAHGSLDNWVREAPLLKNLTGAEPSLIRYHGQWWMFYTVVGAHATDQRELHVAYANALTGPWKTHSLNPVLTDRAGARPGGSPFIAHDGALMLPVQDCSETYGGAIRFLRFTQLNDSRIVFEHTDARFTGALVSDDYQSGFHTLSSFGSLTLLDVKQVRRSREKQWIDFKRRARRLVANVGL